MNQPNFKFVDTAFGGASLRNHPMNAMQVVTSLPSARKDCYVTWHRFSEGYFEHWKQNGNSTGGYVGPSYADFLPFDFDGKSLDDIPEVLAGVREFLQMLEVSYEVESGVRCFFSGYKGFHVGLSPELFGGFTPSVDLPRQLKSLAKIVGQDFDIDHSIYDQNRLLRLENTINSKSGLWKIPLTKSDVLFKSAEEILKMATESQEIEWESWDDCLPVATCVQIWKSVQTGQQGEGMKTVERRELFPAQMAEGDGRDDQAFYISRMLRDAGCHPGMAVEVLKFWDQQQAEPLAETNGDDVLEVKVKSAYGNDVNFDDGPRITIDSLKTIDELAAEYTTYIGSLKDSKIELGFRDIDLRLRAVAPGEVLTVLAKSGVGKSAFLQSVIANIVSTQSGILSVFCSMEQPLAQCFERWAQMILSVSGKEVERGWDSIEYRQEVIGDLNQRFGDRVLTCGVPGLRLSEVGQVVDYAEMRTGRKVNLLALDYMGLIDGSDMDRTLYGQVSRVAREIKNLAKRKELVVMLLCQVSRNEGDDGSKPLSIGSARESGAVEESADYLLGLYRPYVSEPENDNEIVIQILKNRKGQIATNGFSYYFDRKSLRITEQRDAGTPQNERPQYPQEVEGIFK